MSRREKSDPSEINATKWQFHPGTIVNYLQGRRVRRGEKTVCQRPEYDYEFPGRHALRPDTPRESTENENLL